MDENRTSNTGGHRCRHLVAWCSKYRRPVITGDVEACLTQIVEEVCAERDVP